MTTLLAWPDSRHQSVTTRPITEAVPKSSSHILALDGIRGLAVLLVLIFHIFQVEPVPQHNLLRIGYRATQFGQTGVELFFVLSGFLITGILYDSRTSSRYFLNFYGRRTLRIFPLYYGVLIVMLLIVPAFVTFPVTEVSWISLWTFSSNFEMARGAGGGMLGHFWSLAIEEQFYLAWPIFVYALSRKTLMRLCVAAMLAAAALRVFVESRGISAFLFTPCRVDTLLVGAFLALASRSPQGLLGWSRRALVIAMAAMAVGLPLCMTMSGSGSAWLQACKYPIIAALYGAILVIGVTSSPGSWAGWFLGLDPLRSLGKYSYGIYLFHPPMIHLGAWIVGKISAATFLGGLPQAAELILRVVLISTGSCALAWLSWHLYEKPFLTLKRYFQ